MLKAWLKEKTCHECKNTIEQGQLFCKTCGRSRGINEVLQFKKWELIAASVGSSILICLCFMALTSLLTVIGSSITTTTTEDPYTSTSSSPLLLNDVHPQATATKKPQNTRTPKLTSTPQSLDFTKYSCPDKPQVKLRVGVRAIVAFYDVNLRSSPVVPNVWDANIVITMRKDDKMIVIGGPKCVHEGTWWEVKTDGGYSGWIRELQPSKVLLEPIN